MAFEIPTEIPASLVSGDDLIFKIALPTFPAGTWTASYSFRAKEGSEIDFTGTADGSLHSFNVAAATTAGWIAGKYYGVSRVTDGSETHTIWKGYLEIEPNLSQQEGNFDTRSHAQKCLDSINLVLEGKAGRDVLTSTIAGQSISRMSFAELIAAKAVYQNLVDAEKDNAAAANGSGSRRNILVRFGNS